MDEKTVSPILIITVLSIIVVAGLFWLAIQLMGYEQCVSVLKWFDFGIGGLNPAKMICSKWRIFI